MNKQQRLLVIIGGVALVVMIVGVVLAATAPAPVDTRRAVQPGTGADAAQSNLEEGEAFLAENAQREEVATSITGLQFEIIEQDETDTRSPGPEDTVVVDYRGTLIDGTQFDSSYDRGQPATFPLNRVIPGWTEGLQLMTVGDTYRFYIPPNLAYGTNPPPGIPANAVLLFDVELLDIVGDPEEPAAPATDEADTEAEVEATPADSVEATPEGDSEESGDEAEAEPTEASDGN